MKKPELEYPEDLNDFYLDSEATIKMSEVACRHCGEAMMSASLFYAWQRLRYYLDKPIVIASGYRCWEHHVAVYKKDHGDEWKKYITTKSKHLTGEAFDLYPPKGMTAKELGEAAIKAGFTFVIVYSWGIHADVRKRKTPRLINREQAY
jgi:uncharacterized protein YcbK (DUF882 family)